jgi:DNA-binding transcriptional ArsR family regulator
LGLDNIKKYFYNKINFYNKSNMSLKNSFKINHVGQATALFKPIRLEIMKQLVEPKTCSQLAEVFHSSPQKIYYHVKILEKAGLVKKTSERQVRGIMEGYYQAAARSYWLSSEVVGDLGGQHRAKSNISLSNLIGLAEEIYSDVGKLIPEHEEAATLGLSLNIELRSSLERNTFINELQHAVQTLAEKYGIRDTGKKTEEASESYRLIITAYPNKNSG